MPKQLKLNLNLQKVKKNNRTWRRDGMACMICGKSKRIGRHHIYGKNKGYYVILCNRDHKGVHWLADAKLWHIVRAMYLSLKLRRMRRTNCAY